jgi:hypothetical protein
MSGKSNREKRLSLMVKIEQWAREEGIIVDGEEIEVFLKIKRILKNKPKPKKGEFSGKVVLADKHLKEEDWNKILSLPWREDQRQLEIIEYFKSLPGAIATTKEVEMEVLERKEGQVMGRGCLFDGINRVFRNNNMPYRLKMWNGYQRNMHHGDKKYKIVKVKPW